MRSAVLSRPGLTDVIRASSAALIGVRVLTAVATAVTGYVHADLYLNGGYRVIALALLLAWQVMLPGFGAVTRVLRVARRAIAG